MAKFIVCKHCKKLYEYKPETKTEGYTTYITYKCSYCGYTVTTNESHIHYGNDGKT